MPIIGFGGGFGGGGGGSYINGVVPTSADLPTTVGNPALDSVYLAKVGSGVWLINRKPAGLYCRTANNGNAADWTYLGAFPEVNAAANWEVYGSDATKRLKFNVDGLPTATLRTVDAPAGNGQMLVEGQSIGNTTRNSGAFTTLSAAPTSGSALTLTGGTVTASAPLIDASQTWNNAAVTFTGLDFTITDTASANGSRAFNIKSGATSIVSGRKTLGNPFSELLAINGPGRGFVIGNFGASALTSEAFFSLRWQANLAGFWRDTILAWGTDVYGFAYDLAIQRDAADTLAQRRAANPQAYRIYNTFTDANNHERGFMRWSSNVFQIGTEKGGTGAARSLELSVDGNRRFFINTSGHVSVGTSTGLLSSHGLFIDPPASSSSLTSGTVTIRGSTSVTLDNGGDPILRVQSSRVNFGSATNAFPALKRSSTTLQVRLADDLDFAPFECAGLTLNGNLTASTRNIVTDTTTGTRIGTGTTQLLGFWNATPVAQQSSTGTNATGFTANGPANTVHADSTFTGNVGTIAYSISDIVKHLKTIGLIAS